MADWYLDEVFGSGTAPKPQPTRPARDWYLDEQFPDLIPVQEGGAGARRQPGPTVVPIPQFPNERRAARPKPLPPAPRQAEAAPQPQQAVPQAPVPMPPAVDGQPGDAAYAEPDAPTWFGRRVQDIFGKKDKRYADLPSSFEAGAVPIADDQQFKLSGGSDAAYGDFIQKQLGETFTRRFKDANGYEIIGFRKPDGKEQLTYVNKPSWEWNDVDRGLTGMLPYVGAAGVVGRAAGGLPVAAQIVGQAGGAGVTSLAQDALATAKGSDQGVEFGKLIGSVIGGGAGAALAPAAGWAMAKWAERGLIDKATGQLTEKGIKAAQSAGVDTSQWTDDIARTFAEQFARSGNAKVSGVMAEVGDVGIPTTLGQRTKDVRQLMTEQAIRDGVWGKGASEALKKFDDNQWQSMVNATMGEIAPGKPGMSLQLAPHRSPGEYTPSQIGVDISSRLQMARDTARQGERDAWAKVGRITPTDEARAELGAYVNTALRERMITARSNPVTTDMVQLIEQFIEGKAPEQVSKILKNNPTGDVNAFRQILSESYRDLPKGADRAAAEKVYDAFNKWTRDMAEQKLLNAEGADAAVAAANMVTARGVTAELHNIFSAGGKGPGARIMKQILETADSPAQIVRELFVGPTSEAVKPGSIAALNSIKQATKFLPQDEAAALMGDLKLAYWLRVVRNPAGGLDEGKLYNPQVLMKNLRKSLDAQRDVWMTLYTPQERAFAQRIVQSLERGPTFHDWTPKPNSSRSGTMIGNLMQDFMGLLVGKQMGRTLFTGMQQYTGVGGAMARNATDQAGRFAQPMLLPAAGAAGGAQSN